MDNLVNSEKLLNAYEMVLNDLDSDNTRLDEENLAEKYEFHKILYKPTEELKLLITKYSNSQRKKMSNKEKGDLLEEIVFLVFKCLKGVDETVSYTSFDSQLDLLVLGTDIGKWSIFRKILGFKVGDLSKIIVEAKNWNVQIGAPVFSRLCFLMDHRVNTGCSLGIFFAHKGAKGFPIKKASGGGIQRTLKAARATQVLYHSRTGKYIVVFDKKEIEQLKEPGSFITLLQDKIRDLETLYGSYLDTDAEGDNFTQNKQLPPHLAKHA